MAKSMAERQADYRARLVSRADLFDAANEARKRALLKLFDDLDQRPQPFIMTPEERYARAFFLAHPLCSDFPLTHTAFDDNEPGVLAATYREDDPLSAAAFIVAVREVSSIPIWLDCVGTDNQKNYYDADFEACFARELAEVRRIKNNLVRAGLWSTKCS